jgi:tyrosyl-tRNA synthetase
MGAFQSSVLAELAWRDRIKDITHPTELDKTLAEESVVLYAGFDPSADSLHVGNLVPLMGLAFFLRHGHRPIAIIGGATGRIGDPSGKSTERTMLSDETVAHNLLGIERQLRAVLARAVEMHPETIGADVARADDWEPMLMDNYDWFSQWSYIDFLREVGRYFRVNAMLEKDSVRSRLEEREQGISYTEFSYMLLQGFDFLHLREQHACKLQIGGADQWGNITAGTDLIRRRSNHDAFGLTMPLLMSADGKKFGKTEQGAVWLDADKTSPYSFYQYWIQRPDEDAVMLLKTFTFLPQEEIERVADDLANKRNPGQAQAKLAWEVTALVHGAPEADRARQASQMLFGGRIEGLSDAELSSVFSEVPASELARARFEGEGVSLLELLVEVKLCPSKGEARRLVEQGGGYVNNERADVQRKVTVADCVGSRTIVLRAGKKSYHLLRLA